MQGATPDEVEGVPVKLIENGGGVPLLSSDGRNAKLPTAVSASVSAHDLAQSLDRIPAAGVGEVGAIVVFAFEISQIPLAAMARGK